jgi:hypothetical protein
VNIVYVMILWILSVFTMAIGEFIQKAKPIKKKIVGLLIFIVGMAYPMTGVISIAAFVAIKPLMKDASVPEKLMNGYRMELKKDTISLNAKHVLSKMVAYDHFWETGELFPYFDKNGQEVMYSPEEKDEATATSLIRAKYMFKNTLPVSIFLLLGVPIGIVLGSRLSRLSKGTNLVQDLYGNQNG